MFKIFYSWQSDIVSCSNKGLINDALQQACKDLKTQNDVINNPVLERDTLGLPGSPSISDSILLKIRECDAFVADVTIINSPVLLDQGPAPKRLTPNPNVLIELGYAMSHIGNDSVILVMNTYFGEITDLPFDLRGLRTLTYFSNPSISDRATPRKALSRNLTKAVKLIGESVRSNSMHLIIYPKTLNVVGQSDALLNELIKEAKCSFNSETITTDEFTNVCQKVNPNGNAPLIISQTTNNLQYATWLQYMWYQRERSHKFTFDILMFGSFLQQEHIALLASIQQCPYFSQLDHLYNSPPKNQNLEWMVKPIWEYIEICRELKRYAQDILKRRTEPF